MNLDDSTNNNNLHNNTNLINGMTETKENIKIDWHDYRFMNMEKLRTGLGEHGKPARLPVDPEQYSANISDQNGFNRQLSDFISLNRSVPDIRHKEYSINFHL